MIPRRSNVKPQVPRILMVTSEATPFASTGGLGDVLESLPKALAADHEIAVLLPLYQRVALPNPLVIYKGLPVTVGAAQYHANILEQQEAGVRYLFLEIPALYDRPEIYDEYPDNHMRFAALCQAALQVAHYVFTPDIIHCHDWPAALLPLLLGGVYAGHPAYTGIKTILTIHNLAHQGIFPASALAEIGLPPRFAAGLLGFHGHINLLKGAILASDRITTVSPTYAREIQTPDYGFGLDSELRIREQDLTGILNGADYGNWDPEADPNIAEPFSRDDLHGKRICKEQLLAETELPRERAERPVIAIVSRLAEQKGLDLLQDVSGEVAAGDFSLVVMGNGEGKLQDFFREYAASYPDRVHTHIGYDNALAHRIIAGSDMLLMPSRYEPCGLTQLYAMRYGTIPLVRATGGLTDTVDAETGFRFWSDTPQALLECIRTALRTYTGTRWAEMMRAGMEREFSWAESARRYAGLYRAALHDGPGNGV